MPRYRTHRKHHEREHVARWVWLLGVLALARSGDDEGGGGRPSGPAGGGGGASPNPFDAGGGGSDWGGPWTGRPLPTVLTQDELRELAAGVGFPDPHLASAVAMGESRGRTNATNISPREASLGLWQINTRAHPDVDAVALLDPHYNAAQALRISQGGTDWSPWGAFTSGAYKQFL
jgi:Lysozyme like domain